jgi:hypothetical protein
MGSGYPGPQGRKRAIALKAADAGTLLKSALFFVVHTMTPDQLGQVQKVLDAAVVNPVVQKEYNDLMRKSVIAQSGMVVNRDPNTVLRANKVAEGMIAVSEADKHVRLEFTKLLTPDALEPKTDNPDEAAFLVSIRHTLAHNGVWLRFDYKLVKDPTDASRWMIDPRTFQAWLSLGYDGDAIPTPDGRLTRDALLDTTVLGANYYRKVVQGNVQSTLDKAIKRVQNLISDGETLHEQQEHARNSAAPLVVPISDTLGGANFPSKTIWKLSNDLVLQALNQNVGGNVEASSKSILYAAITTQAAAEVLDQYIDDTTTGAQRAVKILTVAKIAGKIAETVLVVRALIGGLVRLMAAEAAESGGGAAVANAAKDRSPGAYYPTNYSGRAAFENTVNQVGVTLNTDAGIGTALDRYDLATQQRITGWYNDVFGKVKELFASTGRTSISGKELDQMVDAANAKWGNPMAFLP